MPRRRVMCARGSRKRYVAVGIGIAVVVLGGVLCLGWRAGPLAFVLMALPPRDSPGSANLKAEHRGGAGAQYGGPGQALSPRQSGRFGPAFFRSRRERAVELLGRELGPRGAVDSSREGARAGSRQDSSALRQSSRQVALGRDERLRLLRRLQRLASGPSTPGTRCSRGPRPGRPA